MTEAGEFMPPMYRPAGRRFSANRCAAVALARIVSEYRARSEVGGAPSPLLCRRSVPSGTTCFKGKLSPAGDASTSGFHTRGDMPDAKSQQQGRERIARVFRYLKALNEHRNPAKRDLSEQPWTLWFRSLPDHPSIQRRFFNRQGETDLPIKGSRPTLTPAPQPPPPIR